MSGEIVITPAVSAAGTASRRVPRSRNSPAPAAPPRLFSELPPPSRGSAWDASSLSKYQLYLVPFIHVGNRAEAFLRHPVFGAAGREETFVCMECCPGIEINSCCGSLGRRDCNPIREQEQPHRVDLHSPVQVAQEVCWEEQHNN